MNHVLYSVPVGMSLPEISIKRPVFATVVLAALILMGIVNYGKMNVDEMPDTSLPYVSVSITYEGAQPDQVDSQVTQKVEEAVGEARGVKHIESTSREGEAEVNVEFNFGIDPAAAAQEMSIFKDMDIMYDTKMLDMNKD